MLTLKKIILSAAFFTFFGGTHVGASSPDAQKLTPDQILELKEKLVGLSASVKKASATLEETKNALEGVKAKLSAKLSKIQKRRPRMAKKLQDKISLLNSNIALTSKGIALNIEIQARIKKKWSTLPTILLGKEAEAATDHANMLEESAIDDAKDVKEASQAVDTTTDEGADVPEAAVKESGWTENLKQRYIRIKRHLDNTVARREKAAKFGTSDVMADLEAKDRSSLASIEEKAGSPFPN